jgi:hypothetical protein
MCVRRTAAWALNPQHLACGSSPAGLVLPVCDKKGHKKSSNILDNNAGQAYALIVRWLGNGHARCSGPLGEEICV